MKPTTTNPPLHKKSSPVGSRFCSASLALASGLLVWSLSSGSGIANDELAGISRGTVVIFEDDFNAETVGEFPTRWNLERGRAETAMHDGEKVLSLIGTRTTVSPRLENEAPLPQSFTIEFQYLVNQYTQHEYQLEFMGANGRRSATLRMTGRDYKLSAGGKSISDSSTPETSATFTPGWKQFALSFDQGAMRVFLDGKRMLHVPRMEAEMNTLQIIGGRPNSARPNSDAFIRNFILTEGGGPIYQQIVEQGKFVTNEIQFDVNKADIKPESSTVIQVVFEMLQSHPDLKFSIEGHTDSDGDAELNQDLSQARAESVMRRLIEMGVTPDRLTAKGWGATKPVADNDSADGKALNRRVEFVKM